MTIEEKYPNFAQLTALLNQRKRPRKTLDSVIACLFKKWDVLKPIQSA